MMTQLKSVAARVVLYAVGFGVGMLLWLVIGFVLAGFGWWPSAALYNAYFFVIMLWIIAAVAAYMLTRRWQSGPRLNLAIFLLGVVTFSVLGGVPVLIDHPEYFIFWPR